MSTSVATRAADPSRAAWLLAIRPKTLPAATAPVLVGCAVAWAQDAFHVDSALAALAVAVLLQIGANLANDVADFRRGADSGDRLGPVRVTQSGLITPDRVVVATAIVLAAAAVPGLYLVWRGGPLLALLGLGAIAAAVAYTAGPRPYGYYGLGEVFVFFFFGPVAVAGTAFVMTGAVTPRSIAASIPMGCLVTAILVVNNLRDSDTDRAAGKRTVAVRLGTAATRWEYTVLIGGAYATPLVMWLTGLTEGWLLVAWVTVPLAVLLTRQVWTVGGRALNPVLGGTARLCLWFALAFSAGIVF